ncbi:MAG: MarR family transcriptional regulator [Actinomycetota bacterium]
MAEDRWLDDTEQRAWRALLVVVNRGLPGLERTLKRHDLLVVHYSMLVALSEAPGRSLRLTDLAEAANVSPSRLSHRLRLLIERGDVAIESVEGDARGKTAVLTETGHERLIEVAPHHVEDVRRLVFDHLDEDETACLAAALGKVADVLCRRDGTTTDVG